ncbi:structural cement protein Gp24 [Entomobacter blattae]|uniref:Bacteriophage protein n=1 Tax=Entomobacter blattae TaxID=2762277 RepID=A0A7H1NU00_9PROT|nr:hypothetical protein [Entomobacter blattae]QNT79260.1 hypothetical protein JGUZn3_20550 [Entomobacter blattae]
MVALVSQIPYGRPGQLARGVHDQTTLPYTLDLTDRSVWLAYEMGMPVKRSTVDAQKIVPFSGGETEADLLGFLVSAYPGDAVDVNAQAGDAVSLRSLVKDVLRRGFILVETQGSGTPAGGGQVFVRIAGATSALKIGGIEAAADGSNTIALSKAFFSGSPDANGIACIEYNI